MYYCLLERQQKRLARRRHNGYSSKFKRPGVSAVRHYPRDCGLLLPELDPRKGQEEITKVHPLEIAAASRPVLRKYPPPKIRKGHLVIRNFPFKSNAPAALRNQMPSDSEDSHSSFGIPMADCEQSDASKATDVHTCRDAKQYDFSVVRNSKPWYVPNSTNVHDVHVCVEPKQNNVSMVDKDCKPMDVSFATNVFACRDVKDFSPSMVVGDEQYEVDSYRVVVKDEEEGDEVPSIPKQASLSKGVGDEQYEVDSYRVVVKDEEEGDEVPSIPKQASLSKGVGDEQYEVDSYRVVVKDEEEGDEVPSIPKQASLSKGVGDEQCSNVHFSDEECEKALLEVYSSQVVISEDLVVTDNKELGISSNKVKEVLHLFQEVYLKLSQESGRKRKESLPLLAASHLLKQQKWINMGKRLGPIPGIEIGDYFDWRAELNVIGLHRQYVCGIDYMELDGRILATSIVDSGRYDNIVESNDEQEFPDVLIYSGQGENPKVQSRKFVYDQKLKGGNLALKNSSETKTPIRVIRKVSFKGASSKIVEQKFVYDGLYFVDSYREERASSGKLVFKFVLKRFPGQPKLKWAKLIRKEHVCMNDISHGKEKIPIRAMNALDDEKPPLFNYVTNVTYPESYHPSMSSGGCDCIDGCSDSEDCPCVIKNGGEIPYNYEECIMMEKPIIIECGPSCKCFTSCINRVSQRGIRFPLEVFKTKTKGWGVRSRSFIPCGSFICEYIGEILPDKEVEQRIGKDEYLFDIGHNYGVLSHSSEVNECFTIDAAQFGNVGRFINHSCSPNLFAQNVLFDHNDSSMPHIMLFAMEDIPPLKELTYDYNYRIGGVCDVNGDIKMKTCFCGSKECTGRMY
ncbi:hypothetical protein SCA6_004388 [Theobroma cacao]